MQANLCKRIIHGEIHFQIRQHSRECIRARTGLSRVVDLLYGRHVVFVFLSVWNGVGNQSAAADLRGFDPRRDLLDFYLE
jgi:hypothetical protein